MSSKLNKPAGTRHETQKNLRSTNALGPVGSGHVDPDRTDGARDLADLVGISRTTLYNIEKGAPGRELGIVLEDAALPGVRLFDQDADALRMENAWLAEKLTLLPKNVRAVHTKVDDGF
ncbi:MAG: hypothetical protein ACNA7O_19850 [Rhodobacterales bacterium]